VQEVVRKNYLDPHFGRLSFLKQLLVAASGFYIQSVILNKNGGKCTALTFLLTGSIISKVG